MEGLSKKEKGLMDHSVMTIGGGESTSGLNGNGKKYNKSLKR